MKGAHGRGEWTGCAIILAIAAIFLIVILTVRNTFI